MTPSQAQAIRVSSLPGQRKAEQEKKARLDAQEQKLLAAVTKAECKPGTAGMLSRSQSGAAGTCQVLDEQVQAVESEATRITEAPGQTWVVGSFGKRALDLTGHGSAGEHSIGGGGRSGYSHMKVQPPPCMPAIFIITSCKTCLRCTKLLVKSSPQVYLLCSGGRQKEGPTKRSKEARSEAEPGINCQCA